MVIRQPDAAAVAEAVALLRAGDVIGLPTETVYGLAADAANPAAVARIFALKGRPLDHPVIVHVADAAAAQHWSAAMPAAAQRLMQRFWPGPLTLIVPRAPHVSDAVTGGQDTVGLRCPSHPVAQAVLRAFGRAGGSGGLAAPSANRFGRISPTQASHVCDEFGAAVPLVLDGGACAVGIESTIVDLSRDVPVVLRPGAILAGDLADCLGANVVSAEHAVALARPEPRVSGALAAHYAPQTALRLVAPDDLPDQARAAAGQGQRVAVWARRAPPPSLPEAVHWHVAPTAAADYAHALYASLRQLDALGCQCILVETPPAEPVWHGVRDRLGRAQAGSGVRHAP